MPKGPPRNPDEFYLVVVRDDLLDGVVETASTKDALDEGSGESYEARLELRRRALAGLAGAVAGQATGDGEHVVATAAFETIAADEKRADPGPPEGVTLYPAIGAMAVDSQRISSSKFADIPGLLVVPNGPVMGPDPVQAAGGGEEVARPDAAHLHQIGLAGSTPGGHGICVGVLDSGIDPAHPEFAGVAIDYAEFDAVGRQVAGAPLRDHGTHGTHVAGLIAGSGCGVAPDACLAIAAVLTTPGRGDMMKGTVLQVAGGIAWLLQTPFAEGRTGVDVINASLTIPGYVNVFEAALVNARNLGILTVAAIGNAGAGGSGRHASPANYAKVVGVGAVDQADTVAQFSDWGDKDPPTGPAYPVPQLSAPGVAVVSAVPGGGYKAMDGTSMAAPIVAGVAARRMAANPALVRKANALALNLQSALDRVYDNAWGNKGGLGRIRA